MTTKDIATGTGRSTKTLLSRGPRRIDKVPLEYQHIPGVNAIKTVEQLTQLQRYLMTKDRPVCYRLGASTPQSPATLMRQGLKRISDDTQARFGIPKDPRHLDADGLIALLSRIVETDPASDDGRKAARLIAMAHKNRQPPYSIWVVEVDGNIEVIHRQNEDPRVSYRWMMAAQRPWNISRAVMANATAIESPAAPQS